MFEPVPGPRLFGLPPGADFPALLVGGLLARCEDLPADRLARVTVYVNTRRMQRRIAALFDMGPARLLPRIRLITDIGRDVALADVPLPVPPLRRRLELAQLIAALIEADPTVAPKSAVFDLADSLAGLIDEMQGEGVSLSAIDALDIGAVSAHWDRSRMFLTLAARYLAEDGTSAPDPEARQRLAVNRLAALWQAQPPADPVIVAGSTGSRGTTLRFMEAVAHLPQGAVILPGLDRDLPDDVWQRITMEKAEDHPQYRFARLFEALGVAPDAVPAWAEAAAPEAARNRLVSLALRPAPVTNQWLRDGPTLGNAREATAGLTLIEAPDPRAEARAIAWLLREAAEHGRKAALVTPDRMLTRRVTALLDRWDIVPDDSAGKPLALSPPGRLLRQTAALMPDRVTLDAALSLLKHPLVHAGARRNDHLRHTRDLELWLRDKAVAWVDDRALGRWAADKGDRQAWTGWIGAILRDAITPGILPLDEMVQRHRALAVRLVAGAASEDDRALWDKPAGRKAAEVMDGLGREAVHGGPLAAADYVSLFQAIIAREEVRDPDAAHPGIMIWGTLEARVQGADLVIVGGLNDGVWPDLPPPDPWLNRAMRAEAGLLLPERRIGLSAHDFQQAIAAPEAVLTRSLRDESAEPVPSRWLNRLTNLLSGLTTTGGPGALESMKERGARALCLAAELDRPEATVPAAARPSPRPPADARPKALSFTQVETLIRDPYAIYARHVLRLKALQPLRPEPDALLRGNILHRIFAAFMLDWRKHGTVNDPVAHLIETARNEIDSSVEWPVAARLWNARVERIAERFVADEITRHDTAVFEAAEVTGSISFDLPEFTLKGRADRIDRMREGGYAILDYKSGTPPTKKQMNRFSVQLLLEALAAEAGGFEGLPADAVREVVYVGLGNTPKREPASLVDCDEFQFATESVRSRFLRLVAAYARRGQGYTARRAMERTDFAGDYDHLSRYGEWDETSVPEPEDVG